MAFWIGQYGLGSSVELEEAVEGHNQKSFNRGWPISAVARDCAEWHDDKALSEVVSASFPQSSRENVFAMVHRAIS